MLVLNELEWAKDMITARSLGNKPYETLCRVAGYYASKDGASKRSVRAELDRFLIQCEPTVSIPKWSDTLDRAVIKAFNTKLIQIDSIGITKNELETISGLGGKQIKRLAFTLLCLAKYWNIVNPSGDNWVNTQDTEIMRMANISTSIKRQSFMYHQLFEQGLVQFSKKVDNTNVRVLFVDNNSDAELVITDLRNLGYQYLMYIGEPFFVCTNCGITTKIRHPESGRRQKYCPSCASEVQLKQIINSVMRRRNVS